MVAGPTSDESVDAGDITSPASTFQGLLAHHWRNEIAQEAKAVAKEERQREDRHPDVHLDTPFRMLAGRKGALRKHDRFLGSALTGERPAQLVVDICEFARRPLPFEVPGELSK